MAAGMLAAEVDIARIRDIDQVAQHSVGPTEYPENLA